MESKFGAHVMYIQYLFIFIERSVGVGATVGDVFIFNSFPIHTSCSPSKDPAWRAVVTPPNFLYNHSGKLGH